MTLNEILALQRGTALLARAVSASGELDIALLAAEAETTAALVTVLAGPGAADEPLHLVARRIRETMPQRIGEMAEYMEQQLEPELARLAELLAPFAPEAGNAGAEG
jgi:hypothetical protein